MAKASGRQSFEIMGHDLVPLHTVLSDTEKKELLKKYNVRSDQLTKILDTDPVVKSIGAKPGDILKISRKSYTAKEAIAYRFIIENNE